MSFSRTFQRYKLHDLDPYSSNWAVVCPEKSITVLEASCTLEQKTFRRLIDNFHDQSSIDGSILIKTSTHQATILYCLVLYCIPPHPTLSLSYLIPFTTTHIYLPRFNKDRSDPEAEGLDCCTMAGSWKAGCCTGAGEPPDPASLSICRSSLGC
jgi:hypothetical protein